MDEVEAEDRRMHVEIASSLLPALLRLSQLIDSYGNLSDVGN